MKLFQHQHDKCTYSAYSGGNVKQLQAGPNQNAAS